MADPTAVTDAEAAASAKAAAGAAASKLSDFRVVARVLLPWNLHKVCNTLSYCCLLGIDLFGASVSASTIPLSFAPEIERTQKSLLPNSVAGNLWPWSGSTHQKHVVHHHLSPSIDMKGLDMSLASCPHDHASISKSDTTH